jgi:hypothetical protein
MTKALMTLLEAKHTKPELQIYAGIQTGSSQTTTNSGMFKSRLQITYKKLPNY